MIKQTCSKCDEPLEAKRIGKQRYCLKCKNENARLNRKKYLELTKDERRKASIRSITKEYVKRGYLEKVNICNCGSTKTEAHHPDYNNPRLVEWMCRACHIELHKTFNPKLPKAKPVKVLTPKKRRRKRKKKAKQILWRFKATGLPAKFQRIV